MDPERVNQAVADTNKRIRSANETRGLSLPELPTISAERMETRNREIVPPPRQQANETEGMLAEFESRQEATQDEFRRNLEREAEESGERKNQTLEQLVTTMLETPGKTELEDRAFSREEGVDDIQSELNDLDAQISREQHALRRKLERLDENPEGLFGGALQDAKEDAERESLRKQADLYVIREGVQGRFDSAKAIADRAVTVQLERQRMKNDALQLLYLDHKDEFTKDEQRAFEAAQSDRERALDAQKEGLQTISDLSIEAIRNGAPTSIVSAMRGATSVRKALELGGGYIGLIERQKANIAASNAALSRRKDLLELALNGDPQAINELGYNPNDLPLTSDELISNEEDYARITNDINRIEGLLANDLGIASSAGSISNVLSTAANPTSGLPSLFKLNRVINEKNDFLTGIQYVTDNLTFDKLVALKAEGATFGALSDNELRAIGNAASELASMTVKDEGNVVGFRGSETKLRSQLEFVLEKMRKAQDDINSNVGLNNSERNEITDIYYGTE